MTQLAEAFGRITGRNVQYVQIPWNDFEQTAGPQMTQMYRWFQDVGYSVDIPALRQENANLVGFERWLQSQWRLRAQTA